MLIYPSPTKTQVEHKLLFLKESQTCSLTVKSSSRDRGATDSTQDDGYVALKRGKLRRKQKRGVGVVPGHPTEDGTFC